MKLYAPIIAFLAFCGFVAYAYAAKTDGEPKVQANQMPLGDGQLVLFCDQDRGNLLYVFITPKGSSITVVPGGCRGQ